MTEVSTYAFPFGPDDIVMVESSNIYGYARESTDLNALTGTLWVIFRSGDVWEYRDIADEVLDEFVGAESIGSAFHRLIRARQGTKLGNVFEGGAE